MNKKGYVSLLMASVMTAGMLAGCSGNNNKQNAAATNSPAETAAATNAAAEGKYPDYSQGFKDKVTLDIPVYERAFEGWNVTDNYYTRWVQKEFGDKYNIDVNYIPITRKSEVIDYEQLLASHKAPDIIFHYDMPQALTYYGEDVMQELDWAEIENYAPTYWSSMGETIKQYGIVDDKNIFFYAARPEADNFTTIIRKDWVEKVGMKVEDLTSLEKYNEMLVKWKEAGLGVTGGSLTANSFNYNYAFRDWPIDANYRALYSDLSVADFTTKETELWLRNLNYQYNNGLIDKEFYLRTDEQKIKSEFVSGKTGTFGLYLTNNTDVISATLANNPDAEFAIVPPYAGVPEGKQPQGRAYWPFGFIMGINYETTDEERAAVWMYLEWLSQPENLFKFQNGVEGENYTLDAEGIAVKNPDFKGESVLSQNNNKDYWGLVTEIAQYPDPEKTLKANLRNWAPAGYEYLADDLVKYYNEVAEFRTPDAMFTTVLEKVNEYKADLNTLFQELYVKIVLAPEAEFDANYEAAKKTYLDAGYQEILDEKQKAIDAGQFR
ncbi:MULTISPECIES: ABC transporter substrate-binding protein [unclassified Paenibacillus]|uniref:ABC transporter substrate-binding protein n=1 Tax=unclassified Paenibacillus TaxID=185978 RepID=UPI002404C2AC|nr:MULTISPECIES: ABC transporter substrate-binding protein [unclassified Paenibacillus]MDF9842718.1 putative aldouronate transport system substrate-binding protein [Paenibacillus sp. PastF-2]MDF9849414.1 putative aldouronate transport system substrate-binding protein [Paenibacillus sp. PastM-2]MDF9855878.1 putative aldouronate transport system substrate-binding protein [Paenibacillus sp. PastF-1]MDH6481256.1 putative aldouronate transport system substrate-binding protein [Paenibacillus sp. Past